MPVQSPSGDSSLTGRFSTDAFKLAQLRLHELAALAASLVAARRVRGIRTFYLREIAAGPRRPSSNPPPKNFFTLAYAYSALWAFFPQRLEGRLKLSQDDSISGADIPLHPAGRQGLP